MRTIRILAVASLVVCGLLLATISSAHATPSPGQVEAQIDQKWNQLEPLIEKYNAVHDQLVAQQAKVKTLQARIQPLALQVDLAMTRVSAISAQRYMDGPGSPLTAMLSTGNPATFVDQLTILNEIAKGQTDTVAAAMALKKQYDVQEAPIDQLVASLTQQQAALTTQKNTINAQINQLNQLRLAAYGTTTATGQYRPAACPSSYDGGPGARAAKWACLQAGKPYVWGAAGPGAFDCSGLTQQAWLHGAGVSMPHNAAAQKSSVQLVSRSQLKIGDLVFYYSDVHHVAIYVGGNWVMSAPTQGEPVQMKPIASSPINSYGRP